MASWAVDLEPGFGSFGRVCWGASQTTTQTVWSNHCSCSRLSRSCPSVENEYCRNGSGPGQRAFRLKDGV